MLNGDADENDIALSFLNLSRMLHLHHGTAPIIIIDEYDTPVQQGHMRGFYEKVIDFMRNLFSGVLKDNPHLSYGFLTGTVNISALLPMKCRRWQNTTVPANNIRNSALCWMIDIKLLPTGNPAKKGLISK